MLDADSILEQAHTRAGAATREIARKRLVMTGGTSGIGRRVVERLLAEYPDWAIILLARLTARSRELEGMRGCERLTVIGTDLASLRSVNGACDDVIRSPLVHIASMHLR
jgi:NAD(P)-dependent dehydrogenase (short-subunit alcohol dehydrogenase family)